LLGFTYKIIESPDGFYGVKQSNESFNGVMGLIERGDVDIVYAMGSTSDRKSIMDFSHPVRSAGNLNLEFQGLILYRLLINLEKS
jgi:hypothetical protein